MSKLCRISIVGLHLLLLTHITHSFVLLTANVEDVKKIARKFVSDSLAERITDFLAKATKTLTEERTNSEEKRAKESSQVSAENIMYNVEKRINDRFDDIRKTKEETTVSPKTLNTEKERHKEVEHTTSTRSKPRKGQPNPLHGRSRYIEPVQKAKPSEETSTKMNVENNGENLKESMKNIESSIPSEPKDKAKQINKTKQLYKLLSAFDYNTTAATTGIPTVTDIAKIDKKPEKNPSDNPKRSMGREMSAGTESESYDTGNEYGTEKAENEFDQYDTGNNKNTEKAANNYDQYDSETNKNTAGASAPMSENDEHVNEINNIFPLDEEVVTRGSLVKEKEFNEDKWWEKELTTHTEDDADIQAEGKSWF